MKTLCIKVNNKKIINYLLDSYTHINSEYVYVSNNNFKNYENIIVHYTGENYKNFYEIFSEILTDCILIFYEEKIIKNLINYNYFYFNDIEKRQILNICNNALESIDDDDETSFLCENSIYNSIYEYIRENKSIVLDGFVTFRLKKYIQILDNLVDASVNKFLIEREYTEFIQILKLYVASSISQISTVHLIYTKTDTILIDENKNIISTDDNLLKAKYLSDITFSSNDYALNTLLNLIPEKIIIHLVDNYSDEFINTLKLIFEDRVQICTDCNICKLYKLNLTI